MEGTLGKYNTFCSNRNWISRAKEETGFGIEQTTDAKFKYSKEEETRNYTCGSCLFECKGWGANRWKTFAFLPLKTKESLPFFVVRSFKKPLDFVNSFLAV